MIRCKHDDCKYKGQLGENISYCNYIGHMHRSRGCDPASCDKYMPKTETGNVQNNSCEGENQNISSENNGQTGEDTNDSKNISGFAG